MDLEKRSAPDEFWDSSEETRKAAEEEDSHGDGSGRWKGILATFPEDSDKASQKAGLPVSQTGSWIRGASAHGGAPARQKAGTGALKTPGMLGL